MNYKKIGQRLLSLTLSGVMLLSSAAMVRPASAAAAFQPIALEAAPTKIMDYFPTQSPAGVMWITDHDALTFLPAAAVGDVTCAVKTTDGAIWVGTDNGLMRIDLSETDARDIVQYFAGSRYLYDGDDKVTGLAADAEGGVWVRNAKGSVHIKMPVMTMQERTYFYEKMITDVNDRRGMVSTSNSFSYDPATDEYTQTSVHTSDNDGLWTAMYAMGEILRYQTLKEGHAAAAEIAAAKAAATRATKAVLLLDYVSGRGNGFPCRSYMLADEALAQPNAAGLQQQNGFWFEIKMLEEEESYPAPIINELKQAGRPIGIATVRITKDAMSKKGDKIFPNDTAYNGLGLSQSSIDTFNGSRAVGQHLGTNIKSTDGDQVFPLMVEGINIGKKYAEPTAANKIEPNDARIKFRLTAPVYEEIPPLFNDLFPDTAIKNGKIDMEQIVYKADTSSDEVDGHYALFLTAYRYLCDEAGDQELKDIIAQTTLRMTDLILKDDRYYIVDATGKATQWSRWLSRYFNDSLDLMKAQSLWATDRVGVDADGEDMLSYGYEDGPLNALEVMSALKIASYIAGGQGETEKATIYDTAYNQCFESPYSGGGIPNTPNSYANGKGYMDMALEYVERRIVRQATDAYNDNDNTPVRSYMERTPDFNNRIFNNALHSDWTQYVNYSDEELGWFPVYALITLEKNSDRYAKIVKAYDQWYEGQEEREENPFYTFVYQMAHPEKTNVDLQSAVRYLYRSPLVRNNSFYIRGDRQDVFYIEAGNRDKRAQTNYALPLDERAIEKNNSNPFTTWTGLGQGSGTPYLAASMGDATVFTLPYWLGRYYGIITESEGSYYTCKTPDATITAEGSSISVTVVDGTAPLARMIVDFYDGGVYIGRARTGTNGIAALTHTATGEITAIVGERLVGSTVYYRTEARPPHPTSISLSLPKDMEMVAGEHHSIDFVILPDSNPYRGVTWSSSNEGVITVDANGRVTAVAPGSATITAKAKADPSVADSGTIKVVASTSALSKVTAKTVVDYGGSAAEEVGNLQKYVDRYTKTEALATTEVPDTIKVVLNDTGTGSLEDVTEGTATWSVEAYGLLRTDTDPIHERDAEQLFMGSRYLPTGDIVHIESDRADGLWIASASAVTHIRLEELSYTDKAAVMSAATQDNVARRGMVSRAQWNGSTWAAPKDDDNDGLWTGMYGVGELMRYSVLRDDSSATVAEVAAARSAALNSIKAVLLLSNITCRTGEVEAYIRPLQNDSNQYNFTIRQEDNLLLNSGLALLKGKDFSVNNPQSGPVGATARDDSDDLLAPFFLDDWALVTKTSNKADFATRARTLEGMIARTYVLDGEFPGMNYNDGYYWDIQGNTATCKDTTSSKVRWESLSGTTVDASGEIPTAVADLLGGATKDNIIYKTDTSTDEVIGHLFIYKVAYDILDDTNPEEAAIKELLVDTVRRIARHLADNSYSFRDATGQATTWGKTERDYFNNSYAWEDCALNSLVNLCVFKLAGYVTGEARWENEYRMLALDDPYRYADLAGEYWDRWAHLAIVDGNLSETASQEEVNTWIQKHLNYSDEEMAMLAYYILFQMEDDSALIGKYQGGIDSWWNSIQYSENPLWYYIYQLAYPTETQTDAYGNDLVSTAAWALSRHPIDTICWGAHNDARPDVVQEEDEPSFDKTTGTIRVVPQDERALHRFNGPTYELAGDQPNQMEPSTTYTLPYWMGRYHNMITPSNR